MFLHELRPVSKPNACWLRCSLVPRRVACRPIPKLNDGLHIVFCHGMAGVAQSPYENPTCAGFEMPLPRIIERCPLRNPKTCRLRIAFGKNTYSLHRAFFDMRSAFSHKYTQVGFHHSFITLQDLTLGCNVHSLNSPEITPQRLKTVTGLELVVGGIGLVSHMISDRLVDAPVGDRSRRHGRDLAQRRWLHGASAADMSLGLFRSLSTRSSVLRQHCYIL